MRQIFRSKVFKTNTPLAANATYTSEVQEALHYTRITGWAYADQAGTLKIGHSEDGVNFREKVITVNAGIPAFFDEPIYGRYVRLVYTNGATAQSEFELVGFLSNG
ncbi:hypothetical protein BSNK01_11910 [Bacillaceae bacterium]